MVTTQTVDDRTDLPLPRPQEELGEVSGTGALISQGEQLEGYVAFAGSSSGCREGERRGGGGGAAARGKLAGGTTADLNTLSLKKQKNQKKGKERGGERDEEFARWGEQREQAEGRASPGSSLALTPSGETQRGGGGPH